MQQSTYLRWRWQQRHGNSLQHGAITARDQSPHHADAGNVRQRHSGLAIVSSDVCGVTRVYAQWIFRPRKLRLAELIVGLQGFYFIPGPPNPTVASANRHFGDHFRVHLVRTTNKQQTDAIDFSNARTEVALRAINTFSKFKRKFGGYKTR